MDTSQIDSKVNARIKIGLNIILKSTAPVKSVFKNATCVSYSTVVLEFNGIVVVRSDEAIVGDDLSICFLRMPSHPLAIKYKIVRLYICLPSA